MWFVSGRDYAVCVRQGGQDTFADLNEQAGMIRYTPEVGASLMMSQQIPDRRDSTIGTSSLDDYLREIRSEALLSSEEETELACAIARGDVDAKARMIRANLRLVVTIAHRYVNRGLSVEDLIGEGNLGLIRACREFNPSYKVRFCTYATHWIKQAIRHALTNTTATIRLPAHMVGILGKWRRAELLLSRDLGRPPHVEEIASYLGLTASQCNLVAHAIRSTNLQRDGMPKDDYSWCSDEVPAPMISPEASLESTEDRCELVRRLERLNDRERAVLTLRYGLDGRQPMTLRDVGKKLGVTREWVRKLEWHAVAKLDDNYTPPSLHREAKRGRRSKLRQRSALSA